MLMACTKGILPTKCCTVGFKPNVAQGQCLGRRVPPLPQELFVVVVEFLVRRFFAFQEVVQGGARLLPVLFLQAQKRRALEHLDRCVRQAHAGARWDRAGGLRHHRRQGPPGAAGLRRAEELRDAGGASAPRRRGEGVGLGVQGAAPAGRGGKAGAPRCVVPGEADESDDGRVRRVEAEARV